VAGPKPKLDESIDDRRMPFTEHLAELRTRLRNSAAAVMLATVLAFVWKERLFGLMERPLRLAWEHAPKDLAPEINFTNLIDPFMVYFKLALLAGIFGASPVIFHQIWKFISPGLYARERRLALPFIFSSVILFFAGAIFAYWFVLPAGYGYFLSFSGQALDSMRSVMSQGGMEIRLRPMLSMDEYFSLTSTLLLMFGAVFELPLLLSVLAMIGIVKPRQLWRFNRYAILIAFIIGAILTPGDLVVGQVAMGGSLVILYNLSILAALIFARNKKKRQEAERAAEKEADDSYSTSITPK
jgi:sec-independent protein translocase protein TatC